MAFPQSILPVKVELYYSGAWNDISSDVYARKDIEITRGSRDESRSVDRSLMSLTLDNRTGTYSPRNPTSPLYNLIGRTTPIRVYVRGFDFIADRFRTDSSSTWGVSEFGLYPWSGWGSGGTIAGSDWTVTSGRASHYVPTTSAFRASYLNGFLTADQVATVTFQFNSADVTGGSVEPNVLLRVKDTSTYYACRAEINADESVTAKILNATSLVDSAIVTGLTHTGQKLRIKGQCIGTTIRMKVWADGTAEPSSWALSVTDGTITGAGSVGIRSGIGAGNTNTSCTISYETLTIDWSNRFAGYVEEWGQDWTTGRKDAWVNLKATGALGRFQAAGSNDPQHSPMYREYNLEAPSALWPLEEVQGASQASNTASTAYPLSLSSEYAVGGAPVVGFGSTSLLPLGADRVLDLTPGGQLRGATGITLGTTASLELEFTLGWSTKPAQQMYVLQLTCPGSGRTTEYGIEVYEYTAGVPRVFFYIWDDPSSVVYDYFLDPGEGIQPGIVYNYGVQLVQEGANVRVRAYRDGVQTDNYVHPFAINLNNPTSAVINSRRGASFSNLAAGMPDCCSHLAIWSPARSIAVETFQSKSGYLGDTPQKRLTRIANANNISVGFMGPQDYTVLGSQRSGTFYEIVDETVSTTNGMAYDSREAIALMYRSPRSLINQTSSPTLTYTTDGHLAPPLLPVEDMSLIANDVTVESRNFASYNYRKTSGPLNSTPITTDPRGVGPFVISIDTAAGSLDQAKQIASWSVARRTVDEPRYPEINVNLANMGRVGLTDKIIECAAADMGDRLVISAPPAILSPDPIDQLIIGYNEILNNYKWSLTFHGAPYSVYRGMVIGSTVGNRGRVTIGNTTLNGALTTSATSVPIISTIQRWIDSTTYGSMFPFDIVVNGERMTVTAVTGSSLSQTATVTRSINGVIKAHASGEAVQLYQPPYSTR